MAWEWSHTAEAYADAEHNLRNLEHDMLVTIAAEWDHWNGSYGAPQLTSYGREYDATEARLSELPDDVLADSIWAKAAELQTCDNGGFNAWLCPFGCHTVPFNRMEDET